MRLRNGKRRMTESTKKTLIQSVVGIVSGIIGALVAMALFGYI